MFKFLIFFFITLSSLHASNPNVVEREAWIHQDTNVTASDDVSNLRYFRYYDILPDEIILPLFKELDLSQYAGKKIFVGYGTADPTGKDCRVFSPAETGMADPIKVCLPWWRVERVYQKERKQALDLSSILCSMPKPRPPIMVDVCRQYESEPMMTYSGGKYTCTSYYSRTQGKGCWENPNQSQCFVDNCSEYVKENCNHKQSVMGEKDNLDTAARKNSTQELISTKERVVTYQYECPAGSVMPMPRCIDEKSVLMFPYECEPDDPTTVEDDGVYVYCDKEKPIYEGTEITGFLGTCPSGTAGAGPIICEVDSFSETKQRCTAPIYESETVDEDSEKIYIKSYTEHEIDVLSGEPDRYAADPNCLRINTVEASREKEVFANIKGEGKLDDDIGIYKHSSPNSIEKIYCNTQHMESYGNIQTVQGQTFSCIDNDGSYSLDYKISILPSDIVSIQQSDNRGRNSIREWKNSVATEVYIDGVLAAPEWHPDNFNNAPRVGPTMITPDAAIFNLTIMFPYASGYSLYFYDETGNEVASRDLTIDDFKSMSGAYKRLELGQDIPNSSRVQTLIDDNNETVDCRDDPLALFDGSTIQGKHSSNADIDCPMHPADASSLKYIDKILVKNYVDNSVTEVNLNLPLPYVNRIFVSKLRVYETRKYRCYNPFPANLGG